MKIFKKKNEQAFLVKHVLVLLPLIYFFHGYKAVFGHVPGATAAYMNFSLALFAILTVAIMTPRTIRYGKRVGTILRAIKVHGGGIVFSITFALVFGCLFLLIDDIRTFGAALLVHLGADIDNAFLERTYGFSLAGFIAAATLFLIFLYGILHGVIHVQIRRVRLSFPQLPQSFDGYKIVQISDLHLGSLVTKTLLEKTVRRIEREKPDCILFTGDLVNELAEEAEYFIPSLQKIKAPDGVLAILGNHDYGDYRFWSDDEEKNQDHDQLLRLFQTAGWHLLLNEHTTIERGGEYIAIIGVENISAKGKFKTYGNLAMAYQGTEAVAFKVLLSHDPTHWRDEVVPKYKDIALMLAGHTHGAQMGLYTQRYKWSPIQYVYPEWAGLYKEGKQYLYVNVGLGVLGYPGRIGIRPEITVIELKRGN